MDLEVELGLAWIEDLIILRSPLKPTAGRIKCVLGVQLQQYRPLDEAETTLHGGRRSAAARENTC